MSDSDLRVAIIGGGIGGLSLGLALRERGLRADVFEQAPELAEIGAAIALSANSLREYARLGLVDEDPQHRLRRGERAPGLPARQPGPAI